MKKYFIMATHRVELRGIVLAASEDDARRRVRDNWYVYDEEFSRPTICAGTMDHTLVSRPIIGAMDGTLRISHIEDVSDHDRYKAVPCRECGAAAGTKCKSLSTRRPINAIHKQRERDYDIIVRSFHVSTKVEGSHI